MQQKLMWGVNVVLLALAGFLILTASQPEQDASAFMDNVPQIFKPVDLDQPFLFAGETLPTDNFDVRERLDRELTVNTYWHSSTILSIKSMLRYFPIMERILREEGVPEDLKYVAVAESSLRNAVSPAGARGIWQFMEGTAGDYNLEVNREIDERYDLEKSTRAAAQYFKRLHDRFGSWALATAAYNMGASRLRSTLEEQRAESYFDININEETSRYYFRLVAIKYIMEDPRAFGFYLDQEDYYAPLNDYRTVEVSGPVENWGDFAREHGTTYRMLKVYNPWLLDSKLTNRSGKTYEIRVPR
ncbi:MAG: lytic transglycosylase domain-containing protein [Lewinella sp.]|nr:lytic transglycosylase domain-containing protein [Lewinella sp.]